MADILDMALTMSGFSLLTALAMMTLWLLVDLCRLRCSKTALLLLLVPIFLRMAVPWAPPSPLSFFNWEPAQAYADSRSDFMDGYVGDYQMGFSDGYNREGFDRAVAAGAQPRPTRFSLKYVVYYESEDGAITPAKTFREAYGHVAAAVWLGVAGAILGCTALSYTLLRRRLRFAIKDARLPGVWYSDRIKNPCVVGFFRPQIYLTFALSEQQKEHILLHELEHIRNGDHIWKALGWVLLTFHWFNPLLWTFHRAMVSMLEDACDQRVMNRLGRERRQEYSESLLALAARPWFSPGPSPVAFGESDVRSRVKAVLRYRRPIPALTALVLLAGAALSLCLLTGPIR